MRVSTNLCSGTGSKLDWYGESPPPFFLYPALPFFSLLLFTLPPLTSSPSLPILSLLPPFPVPPSLSSPFSSPSLYPSSTL